MRLLSLDQLKPGMVVGKTIYNSAGQILLASGITINDRYINRLRDLGVFSLYIVDESLGPLEVNDVIDETTRVEAVKLTKELMTNVNVAPNMDTRRINKIINDIVDDLLSNDEILVNLVDIRALDDYTFGHSVNVATLSIITGIALGYNQLRLKELGAGALFHDIGKVALNKEIWNKPGPLSPEEFEEAKKHTQLGFEILRKIPNFSSVSASVALQHHEKYNGQGYPRGLKGEEIHEFARIVCIAEVYDAMSADTPYRPRFLPHEVLEYLTANGGILFDPEIVKVFVENIAIFPVGSFVLLNTGEKCVVTRARKDFPTRPEVRILVDRNGKRLKTYIEMDLLHNPTAFITQVLKDEEL